MATDRHHLRRFVAGAAFLLLAPIATLSAAARPDGQLEIRVVDSETSEPLAARIHLRDARQRPVRTRGLGVAAHGDHFYVDGSTLLGLRRGQYTFDLDAGWERRTRAGHFEIDRRSEDTKEVEVSRFANLVSENWHGADLDADRSLTDLSVVLRAEQLAYLPLTEWRADDEQWKQASRTAASTRDLPSAIGLHAARLETAGGDLLFFRPGKLIDPTELPSPGRVTIDALQSARDAGYRIVAADLTAWDLPVWLAAGVLDAVCLIDRTSGYDRVETNSSTGRRRDTTFFPGKRGPGRWREAIYFQALNAGLQLPAVAGSGSGDTDSPLGTNRVYAHCDVGFSPEAWWQAIDAGQTVVTNGPLLRPSVFGEPPGFEFRLDSAGSFSAPIALNLSTRTKIDYLELIQNGEAVVSVRLADWAAAGGKLPELDFNRSGWFAIRAVTTDEDRYQLALSSPYYVSEASNPRISRKSCQFFFDWLDEAAEQADVPDWRQAELAKARNYWQTRLANANAP